MLGCYQYSLIDNPQEYKSSPSEKSSVEPLAATIAGNRARVLLWVDSSKDLFKLSSSLTKDILTNPLNEATFLLVDDSAKFSQLSESLAKKKPYHQWPELDALLVIKFANTTIDSFLLSKNSKNNQLKECLVVGSLQASINLYELPSLNELVNFSLNLDINRANKDPLTSLGSQRACSNFKQGTIKVVAHELADQLSSTLNDFLKPRLYLIDKFSGQNNTLFKVSGGLADGLSRGRLVDIYRQKFIYQDGQLSLNAVKVARGRVTNLIADQRALIEIKTSISNQIKIYDYLLPL